MAITALFVALVSTALAQTTYKLYMSRHRRVVILMAAMALFATAQGGFFLALTGLEIGVVYFSMGLVHVLVMLLSRLVLGERVTLNHWIAVSLILAGLALYSADRLGS